MKYYVNDSTLSSLADTIRSKTGLSGPLAFPSGFQSAVEGISAPYYGIYKVLAEKLPFVATGSTTSSYTYTASEVSAYCDSFSYLTDQQFVGVRFSGTFTFNNLTKISYYAFGSAYTNTQTGNFYNHNFNLPQITSIVNGTFIRDQYLETISASNCQYIGEYAFSYCRKLISLNFPSCLTIGTNAFEYCTSLTTVSFPLCTSLNACAFRSCYLLTSAYFPNCTFIGQSAFATCSSLSIINFSNCTSIRDYAFYQCSSLNSVNLPVCTSVGNYAFQSCSLLTTLNLPQCSSTGYQTFCRCTSLSIVSLPVCKLLSGNVFSDCYNLISLYLTSVSVVTTLQTGVFNSTPIGGYSGSAGRYGSVFVPASLYNSFITATNWASLSSRIVSV